MSAASARAQQPEETGKLPYPDETVFLIPDIEYDAKVIKGYLAKKYKGIPREMIVSQANTHAVPHLASMGFIVCVRRAEEGEELGLSYTVGPDDRGILRERPIAPDSYHSEVVENSQRLGPLTPCKPIKVTDYVKAPKTSLFASVETDVQPLVVALSEHAHPCRVTVQNKPDFLLRMVVAV